MARVIERNTRLATLGSAAAGIAHDLNNQLTLVLNYLETTDLAGARDAASRCRALTASLLSYCRGESLALRPMDPRGLIFDFAWKMRFPDRIAWSVVLDETEDVKADPAAIRRVLANLAENACDAMNNEGSIHFRASGKTIEVRDTGPGIPSDRLRKIFAPFYSTKGSKGTGLGLAIAREIMRQHGGSITVHSEQGKGAVFTLRFR